MNTDQTTSPVVAAAALLNQACAQLLAPTDHPAEVLEIAELQLVHAHVLAHCPEDTLEAADAASQIPVAELLTEAATLLDEAPTAVRGQLVWARAVLSDAIERQAATA